MATQISFFSPLTWGDDPIWRAYFSDGLVQPPSSFFYNLPTKKEGRRYPQLHTTNPNPQHVCFKLTEVWSCKIVDGHEILQDATERPPNLGWHISSNDKMLRRLESRISKHLRFADFFFGCLDLWKFGSFTWNILGLASAYSQAKVWRWSPNSTAEMGIFRVWVKFDSFGPTIPTITTFSVP